LIDGLLCFFKRCCLSGNSSEWFEQQQSISPQFLVATLPGRLRRFSLAILPVDLSQAPEGEFRMVGRKHSSREIRQPLVELRCQLASLDIGDVGRLLQYEFGVPARLVAPFGRIGRIAGRTRREGDSFPARVVFGSRRSERLGV